MRLQALGLDPVVVGEQHVEHLAVPSIGAAAAPVTSRVHAAAGRGAGARGAGRGRRSAQRAAPARAPARSCRPRARARPRAAPRTPRSFAPAARDLEHRADEHAVHVAQEHVGLDPELEQLAVAAATRRARTSQRNQRVLGLGRRERREVVAAARAPRAHCGERVAVDRARPPERAPALEHAARAPREHAVAVGPAGRVAARVEALAARARREHRDVVGEQRVQAQRIDRLVLVARHLPPGVHAAIGAPRHRQRQRLPSRPSRRGPCAARARAPPGRCACPAGAPSRQSPSRRTRA